MENEWTVTDNEGTLVHTGTKEQSDFYMERMATLSHANAPFTQSEKSR